MSPETRRTIEHVLRVCGAVAGTLAFVCWFAYFVGDDGGAGRTGVYLTAVAGGALYGSERLS